MIYSYLLIALFFALIAACAAPRHHILETEKDYQEAFNRVYFQGHAQMEVPVNYGRIDLLTGDYAIEVERLDKFHEGIGQALHYAKETDRKPGLAVFITDPTEHELEKLRYVRKLCQPSASGCGISRGTGKGAQERVRAFCMDYIRPGFPLERVPEILHYKFLNQ
ncbi:MAG: hypothetical protein ACXWMO_10250 [Syntrophales bacterium]